MLNVNIEIINGDKYYSTTDSRGNTTMVFVWDGQMYVQTNRSPAKCIEDVKRLSKVAKSLIDFVTSEQESQKDEEEKATEGKNERYVAFVKAHGLHPNWEYMAFIGRMVHLYTGKQRGRIIDHDDFTSFIKSNAHRYEVTV